MAVKTAKNKQHGGKINFYIFLGSRVEDMNSNPWPRGLFSIGIKTSTSDLLVRDVQGDILCPESESIVI